MLIRKFILSALALATASIVFPAPVQAGGGHGDAAVAGVAGFALGTLLGTATARPRYYPGPVYVEPAPVYVAPQPVYVAPPPPVVYEPAPVVYVPAPWTPDWYSYCARKYRSFDAGSGTYIGYDGLPHTCQ